MWSFVKSVFLFFLPILLVIGYYERKLKEIPNDYRFKNEVLSDEKGQYEVLVLGSSHCLYGVNPEYLSKRTFNAAQVSQSIDLDYEIFSGKINQLNSVKYLVLRVSYATLFELLSEGNEDWRINNYLIYYSDLKFRFELFKRFEMFNHNFDLNLERISLFKEEGKGDRYCVSSGWSPRYKKGGGERISKEQSLKTVQRHSADHFLYYEECKRSLEKLMDLCRERDIKVVLFTPPASKHYRENLNEIQLKLTRETCQNLSISHSNVKYLDLLFDENFTQSDFFDADHLNHQGAEKLSKTLNTEINNWD